MKMSQDEIFKLEQVCEEKIINQDVLDFLKAASVFEMTRKTKEMLKSLNQRLFLT